MSPNEYIELLLDYLERGGIEVMGPLAVATLMLWYTLGMRVYTLRRGSHRDARQLIDAYLTDRRGPPRGVVDRAAAIGVAIVRKSRTDLRRLLDDGFAELEHEMDQGRVLVRSIVGAAPLAGLLGTVTGMIETFNSLGDMSLFSQSGGIAGGIAQALFTTQMGLSVAVPGVIAGKLLERRQVALSDELAKIKDILCHRYAPDPDATPDPNEKPTA
ncbi:MAG: MotA/TolQ/ExbB proton channel family protein [Myxococcales bacterium]|nr:MotA/TolQ/ExbB proton channel family protein [Myxococcales bacterium]